MSSNPNDSSSEQGEAVVGVGMIIAAFVDELAADQVLKNLQQARKEGMLYFDDAAVVRQDAKGKVHIKETGDMSTGKGSGVGALIGGLVGLLGGPAGVALGAGAGAAIGAISAHADGGFDHESLKKIGAALVPGSSAIAATTSQDFVEAFRAQAPDTVRLASAQQLADGIRASLAARQDLLFGLAITEAGVASVQISSSPTMVEIFGQAASEEGIVAGHAVIDASGAAYEAVAADADGVAYEAGASTEDDAAFVNVQASEVDDADDADTATGDENTSV